MTGVVGDAVGVPDVVAAPCPSLAGLTVCELIAPTLAGYRSIFCLVWLSVLFCRGVFVGQLNSFVRGFDIVVPCARPNVLLGRWSIRCQRHDPLTLSCGTHVMYVMWAAIGSLCRRTGPA